MILVPARAAVSGLAAVMLLSMALAAPVSAAPAAAPTRGFGQQGPAVSARLPRASIQAALSAHSSGKLLVTVASDARRVRLSWRTAKRAKRAAILRISNGTASGLLPKGSTRVYARALATAGRRASVRVAVLGPAMAPVTGLTATVSAPATVTLGWVNPPGLAAVVVRRAKGSAAPIGPTKGTAVPLAAATATSATDAGLAAGATYSYAVFAVSDSGTTSVAASATATMPAATIPAATPATAAGCAQTIVLGQSVRGRAIEACRLTGSSDQAARTVLVVGSMHGNEQAGIGIAARLRSKDLSPRPANLWVIDTVNPDGTGANVRGNAHGVDLNRNFPTSGWKEQGKGTILWGGAAPASEPETQAFMAAVAQIRPNEVVVFHQHMNLIDCAPYRPATLSRTLHELTGYRYLSPSSCLPTYVGTFTAWADQSYGWTSAVTFELEASPTAARLDHLAGAMVSLAAR